MTLTIFPLDLWPVFNEESKIIPQAPSEELKAMLSQIEVARIKATIEKLVSFGTRHTLSTQTNPERGIGAARDWIASEMRSYAAKSDGVMSVEIKTYDQPVANRVPFPIKLHNVVATIKGSVNPGRVYVVSGHYDSINSDILNYEDDAPGANDDASGTAVVLELARILAQKKPHATIMLAAVAGEEQGLLGSAFMAKELKTNAVNVEAMLNNDIVGSSTGDQGQKDPYTLRMFAQGLPSTMTAAQIQAALRIGAENDTPARQLARFVRDVASNDATEMNVQTIYRLDRYGRGGDHSSFLSQGYAAVRFTEPMENFAHQHQFVRVQNGVQYGDLIEFVDMDYVARVAKVNLASIWSLANSPGLIPRVRITTGQLTNDSQLSWSAPAGEVAGYEIVWRPTTSSDWTNQYLVKDVFSVLLPISKDNVIFGVRAVGPTGLRGPVTSAS